MWLWDRRPGAGTLSSTTWIYTGDCKGQGRTSPGNQKQGWLRDQCSEQKGVQVGERVINSCHQSFAQTLLMHSAIVMQNPGQLCSWVDGVRPDLLRLVPALLA